MLKSLNCPYKLNITSGSIIKPEQISKRNSDKNAEEKSMQ